MFLLLLLLCDSIQKGVAVSAAAAAGAFLIGCGGNLFLFRVLLIGVDEFYTADDLNMAAYHKENDRIRKEHLHREEQQDEKLRTELLSQVERMEAYVQRRKEQIGSGADELKRMTGEMEEILQKSRERVWCENTLLNVLVYDKTEKAEKCEVCLEAVLKIPDELSVHPLELCSVFSNLLDNAIEAASGVEDAERKILLRAAMFSGTMVIKVKNPYAPNAVNDPARYRKNDGVHGIGLKIVKKIAEKYHGGISIKRQEGIFQTIVYLDCGKERTDA